MQSKEIWYSFLYNLQLDLAECLRDNILNFSTLLLIIKLYVELMHPQYAKIINGAVDGYLLTLPTQTSIKKELKNEFF